MNNRLRLTCLLGLSPLLALGAGSSTQPADSEANQDAAVTLVAPKPGPTTKPQHSSASSGPSRPWLGQRGAHLDSNTQSEWENNVQSFMKQHSPERLKFIEALNEGPGRAGMVNVAVRSFRNYERLRITDPELAKVSLSRIEVEDQIFNSARQLRRSTSQDQAAAKDALNSEVSKLVEITIEERQLRIARLKKVLTTEEQLLANDSAQRDKLVADRVEKILSEAQRFNKATTEPSHSDLSHSEAFHGELSHSETPSTD